MKKLLILLTAMALVAFWAGLSVAGGYHTGTSLLCADCHTMHASQQHNYSGTGSATTWTPTGYLLKGSQDAVCLSCHDGQTGIPDVSGADVNTTPSGGRQAGALTTGTTPYENWKGHTLGVSSPVPGGTGSQTLACSSCHDVHGNAYYRNLAGGTIGYTTSTTAGNTTDVRINLATVPAVGSRVSGGFYSFNNIFFNEVSTTNSPYGDLCSGCHGSFHGTGNTGSSSPFTRHPTEAISFSSLVAPQYQAATSRVQAMMASNSGSVTYDTTTSPSCMSCHKGHGNQNPFGLIYMQRGGLVASINEQGHTAGTPEDLCRQCHNK